MKESVLAFEEKTQQTLVSSGHSGFLPHEDNPNANIGANEHD